MRTVELARVFGDLQAYDQASERSRLERLAVLSRLVSEELAGFSACGNANGTTCPRCGSFDKTKRGHDGKGRQRFRCCKCGRSFTLQSTSILSNNRLSRDTWMRFLECHAKMHDLRTTARLCGVCLKTAWFMRQRVLALLKKHLDSIARKSMVPIPQTITIPRDTQQMEVKRPEDTGNHIVRAIAGALMLSTMKVMRNSSLLNNRSETDKDCLWGSVFGVASSSLQKFLKSFRRVSANSMSGYMAWFDWIKVIEIWVASSLAAEVILSAISSQSGKADRSFIIDFKPVLSWFWARAIRGAGA